MRRTFAALVAVCSLLIPAVAAHAAPSGVSCAAPIRVIGVPASGEVRVDNNPYNPANMGRLPNAVFSQFNQHMAGRGITVQPQAVFYPATGVRSVVDIPRLIRSVNTGAKNLTRILVATAVCTKQRIILIAFSQGAWVVQKALQALPASARRHMVVLIMGSPAFQPKDGFAAKDPSQKAGGVAPDAYLPKWIGYGRTYCLKGDAVCEFTARNVWNCRQLGSSTCPHSQYGTLVAEGVLYLIARFPVLSKQQR